MITYTMTKEELSKELLSDCLWLDSLRQGISIKYRKYLNPKTATEGHKTLAVTTYITPKNNKVICAWVRVKAGKCVTVESMHFYEYTTNQGVKQYINPCYKGFTATPTISQIVVYSAHALQRLKERANMSLYDMFNYKGNHIAASQIGEYTYKDEKHTMFNFCDIGMFIYKPHEWGIIATTFINLELLGEEQSNKVKECYDNAVNYSQSKMNAVIDYSKSVPRNVSRKCLL